MAFVHVKHVRLDSERGERFDSADPEHDLLTHPHLEIASVKLSGDQSVFCAVLRDVGVEEIDVHAADAQFPNSGENFPIQNWHRNQKLCFAPADFADRQVIEILVEVNRCLHAVLVDLLSEIAVPVEQTNRNEIQIKIACRFAMVAGQDPESTGVIRDRLVKTEFGGKIGDRILDSGTGPASSRTCRWRPRYFSKSWKTCLSSRKKFLSCASSSSRDCRESCSMRTGL